MNVNELIQNNLQMSGKISISWPQEGGQKAAHAFSLYSGGHDPKPAQFMGKLHGGTQHGKIPQVLKTQETRNNLGSISSRSLILGR